MARVAMLSVHTSPLAALGGKETGGMNVYVRDLSKELAKLGHEVDIFTRWQDSSQPQITQFVPGVRVIQIEAGPRGAYDKNKVYNHLDQFVAGVEALRLAEGGDYDVIHAHYWLSGLVGIRLREKWLRAGRRVPVLQMFHTLGKLKNGVAQTVQEREVDQRIRGEEEVVRQVDRLIAPTPTEKAHLIWYYGASSKKVRTVPCGVDTEMFHPMTAAERRAARRRLDVSSIARYALFVGRIEPLKGVETLLRAVHKLAETEDAVGEMVKLLVVGGDVATSKAVLDAEMLRLQYLAADLGICDRISFVGAQPQEKLRDYYASADVVLMPSRYESFGMVAVEAMASGTPVIASRVGGLAYTVRDGQTGYLLAHDDVNAWAEAIHRVLDSPLLRAELGQQASSHAHLYAWAQIAMRIDALYAEVLDENYVAEGEVAASSCGVEAVPTPLVIRTHRKSPTPLVVPMRQQMAAGEWAGH